MLRSRKITNYAVFYSLTVTDRHWSPFDSVVFALRALAGHSTPARPPAAPASGGSFVGGWSLFYSLSLYDRKITIVLRKN